MTTVIESLDEFRAYRSEFDGRTVGLVPTMGALHHGHASLIRRSVEENDATILTIFVNPTQFDRSADLEGYPRTFEADQQIAVDLGVDAILFPRFEDLYPDGYVFRVSETEFSAKLCGSSRPGHFDGVLTVVMKLLNVARPTRAYFGEKDYQQLSLIRGMVSSFFMPIEVIACPTVREPDGLAASSRNLNLTALDRQRAPLFARILGSASSIEEAIEMLSTEGFEVDYVEDIDGRRFGAVFLGGVRLIDNLQLSHEESYV